MSRKPSDLLREANQHLALNEAIRKMETVLAETQADCEARGGLCKSIEVRFRKIRDSLRKHTVDDGEPEVNK